MTQKGITKKCITLLHQDLGKIWEPPKEEVEEYGIPAHKQTQPHRMLDRNSPNRQASKNRNTREAALCRWA